MDTRIEAELAEQIDKLAARYRQLAEWLGETIRDMEEVGRPPSNEILRDLGHAKTKFGELRDRVHLEAAAEGISPLPDPDHLISLEDLRELLARVEDSRTRMIRRKDMCRKAQATLDRVAAIAHRDEPGFPALNECHAKASELRQKAVEIEYSGESDPPADALDEIQSLADGHHAFCDLLVQVDDVHSLDDERWHDLTAHLARAFGKNLATAAARGKLVCNIPPPDPAPEPTLRSGLPTDKAIDSGPAAESAGEFMEAALTLSVPATPIS